MNDLIQWCNENQGFISAILAIFSLLLSVIAIYVSITVANFPYKKKISVVFYTNMIVGAEDIFYSISATNIGNRPVMITYVGFGFYKNGKFNKFLLINRTMVQKKILNINESIEERYTKDEVEDMRKNGRLYAVVYDVEGNIYKRKLKY